MPRWRFRIGDYRVIYGSQAEGPSIEAQNLLYCTETLMHTYTNVFGRFHAWSERRLAWLKLGTPTPDEQQHEDFEARENVGTKKVTSPRDAASVIAQERDSLVNRVAKATRSGIIRVPYLSAWSRKRAADRILEAEAERLSMESNPQLARKGRLWRYLSLGWYRDALSLAHMHRTKKELAEMLLRSMESAQEASVNRKNRFAMARGIFGNGKVQFDTAGRSADEIRALFQGKTSTVSLMDVPPKHQRWIADALKEIIHREDGKVRKYELSIPAKYETLLQRELELRTALDASGLLPIGDVMDRLIDENRQGKNTLLDRILQDPTVDKSIRDSLYYKARELQGSGAIGTFFRREVNNYYNVMKAMTKTVNVLPIEGRLKYLRESTDIQVLYKNLEVQLPNDKTRRMQVKRREGEYVFLEETSGGTGSRLGRLSITINTTHRRVTRKGPDNAFLPPVYLGERSLHFV